MDELWFMQIKYIAQDKHKDFESKYNSKIFKIDSKCFKDQNLKNWLKSIVTKNRKDFEQEILKKEILTKINFIKIKGIFQGLEFSIGICIKQNKEGKFKLQAKFKENSFYELSKNKEQVITYLKEIVFARFVQELN